MAVIKIDEFRGISERISPKKLPDGMATYAVNVDFTRGSLRACNAESIDASATADFGSFSGATDTLFVTQMGYFLAFNDVVDIVESPIADDTHNRIYLTGNSTNPPQIVSGSTVAGLSNMYELGIPRPPAPTVTLTPTTSANEETENPISRAYLATYVTDFGEEGPPSIVTTSNIYDVYTDQEVRVSVGAATGATRNFAYIRIYRTDADGSFRFLTQVSSSGNALSPFLDTFDDVDLGEEVPSSDWVGPDANMVGLTAMPNGITAGFFDQTLCFSEAYLPHAWPEAYRLTTSYKIVGLARMDTGLLVLTEGKPYMVQGSDPSGLVMTELDIAQACIRKRSIVEMGDSVIYASPDGLVQISPSGARVVSEAVFDKKQWNSLPLYRLHAVRHEDQYVGFMNFDSDIREGFVFDPRGGKDAFSWLDIDSKSPEASFNYLKDDTTYIINNNGDLHEFRDANSTTEYRWYSKEFYFPRPVNFGVIQIEFGTVSVSGGSTTVAVKVGQDTADTSHYAYAFTSGTGDTTRVERLPSGNKFHCWSVWVYGYTEVVSITLAESAAELR